MQNDVLLIGGRGPSAAGSNPTPGSGLIDILRFARTEGMIDLKCRTGGLRRNLPILAGVCKFSSAARVQGACERAPCNIAAWVIGGAASRAPRSHT